MKYKTKFGIFMLPRLPLVLIGYIAAYFIYPIQAGWDLRMHMESSNYVKAHGKGDKE